MSGPPPGGRRTKSDLDRAVLIVNRLRHAYPQPESIGALASMCRTGRARTEAALDMLIAYGLVRRQPGSRILWRAVPPGRAGITRAEWTDRQTIREALEIPAGGR